MAMNEYAVEEQRNIQLQLADHPIIAMFVFWLLSAVMIFLFAVVNSHTGRFSPFTGFIVMVVIVTPLLLQIPRTNPAVGERLQALHREKKRPRTWLALHVLVDGYREYMDAIRLTRIRPLIPLLLLGLSCWLILACSQALGTIIFRISQGLPLTAAFILDTFSIAEDLPPQSTGLFTSLVSVFEEIAWRGVFLALFLQHYDKCKAVIMAAVGFSLLHLLNLTGEQPAVWVLGQVGWSFVLGLWYGYAVLKTDSLIPAMLVHWLGNAFIWSITHTLQTNATPAMQAVYGLIFTVGIVPAVLLSLWTRFVTTKWPVFRQVEVGHE